MSTRARYGQAVKAAIYQLEHKMTTKAAAKMFGVNHLSIGHARRRKNISHPFPRKNHAIKAAKLVLDGKLNIETAIKTYKASRGTICGAVNRMGQSMMALREDRRIFKNRSHYYFRLRTKDKTVFKTLSDDIHVARIMRDKLEHKLGLSK
jgi:plasmid stabilization system protein ParE